MKKEYGSLFFIFLLVVLPGCASLSIPQLQMVSRPTMEEPLMGFSVLPPQDSGWSYFIRRPDKLGMGKRMAGLDHTLSALALRYKVPDTVKTPEEFLKYVIELRIEKDKADRFNVLKFEVYPDEGKNLCAQSHWKGEDHKSIKVSKVAFLILESFGYACFHPRDKTYGYYFEFSERAEPDKIDENLSLRAHSFFQGIREWTDDDEIYWDAFFASMKGKNDEAYSKIKPLAEKGHPLAQTALGWMYANGLGVLKDPNESFKWFQKAADQGNLFAQMRLGYAYSEGLGVQEDDVEAIEWYKRAAEQNEVDAQYDLGIMYYYGEGVSQDYSKAHRWFENAGRYGHPNAANMVGQMYYKGVGVEKDNIQAYIWWKLSAVQGNKDGKHNIEFVSNSMTRDQIKKADRIFLETFYPGSEFIK